MALLRGPDHVFELTNAAYVSLVGRDVLGKAVREALPELAGQGFFERLDRVYTTGEAATARRAPITFASSPDGALDRRFVDFVYQPVRDATGAVTSIFVEGSDVTEATLTEIVLRASEARQALLLRLTWEQRETSDPDAMMLAASEAVGRHLGAHRVGFLDMLDDHTLTFAVGWTDGSLALLAGAFPAAEIGARAIIDVPIIRNGRRHAGMYVNHATVRNWTKTDVALVREVADQTWDAVERARAEAALRELNETLEARVAARTAERSRLWSMTNLLVAAAAFDSTIREVNPAWPALLGWSEAELVGWVACFCVDPWLANFPLGVRFQQHAPGRCGQPGHDAAADGGQGWARRAGPIALGPARGHAGDRCGPARRNERATGRRRRARGEAGPADAVRHGLRRQRARRPARARHEDDRQAVRAGCPRGQGARHIGSRGRPRLGRQPPCRTADLAGPPYVEDRERPRGQRGDGQRRQHGRGGATAAAADTEVGEASG